MAKLAALVGRKKWSQVELVCLGILQDDPDEILALHYAAMAAQELGDFQAARVHRLKVHTLEPEDFENLRQLSWLFWRLGEVERSRHFLRLAIDAVPNSHTPHSKAVVWLLDVLGRVTGRGRFGTELAKGAVQNHLRNKCWATEAEAFLASDSLERLADDAGPPDSSA